MLKFSINIIAALVVLFSSGCVLGRRTVDLSVPKATSYPAAKGEVSIVSVVDARVFENKPGAPSTPSVDGDVSKLTPSSQAEMIGRQRNTYGKALGDIALPTGRNVVLISSEVLAEALKRKGYTPLFKEGAPVAVTAKINEFWAWFTPGMWAVTFEARLHCTLSVVRASDSKQFTISGYGVNKGQIASDANWQLAYQRAFEDFLVKAEPELTQAGF